MAEFTKQLTADDADAIELDDGTGFAVGGSFLMANSDAAANLRYNAGLWFDNVTIPKNAPIISAKVTVYVRDTTRDDINVTICGNAVNSANNFTDEADVTSRATTTASVDWVLDSAEAGLEDSPDITGIIEELTTRAGWASGQNICILLKGKSDATKVFHFREGEAYPGDGATLFVEYTPPAGWTGKISGVTNPTKINGIAVASIAKVMGV